MIGKGRPACGSDHRGGVVTADQARGRSIGRRQRADAAVAVDHLLPLKAKPRQEGSQTVQKIFDFWLFAPDVIGVVTRDVCGADEGETEIAVNEADAAIIRFEIDHMAVQTANELRVIEQDMRSFRAADQP